jgi:uncharacterized GH25 family protein
VETYVTRGASTSAALKPSGKGLELVPLTHPSEIYLDQGFAFELRLNGAPAKDLTLSLYRDGNVYDDKKIAAEIRTDAKGQAKVTLDRPGIYLLTASYPTGEAGGAPPAQRYVYSLTFEATH